MAVDRVSRSRTHGPAMRGLVLAVVLGASSLAHAQRLTRRSRSRDLPSLVAVMSPRARSR